MRRAEQFAPSFLLPLPTRSLLAVRRIQLLLCPKPLPACRHPHAASSSTVSAAVGVISSQQAWWLSVARCSWRLLGRLRRRRILFGRQLPPRASSSAPHPSACSRSCQRIVLHPTGRSKKSSAGAELGWLTRRCARNPLVRSPQRVQGTNRVQSFFYSFATSWGHKR
jgi:hypothetical protein